MITDSKQVNRKKNTTLNGKTQVSVWLVCVVTAWRSHSYQFSLIRYNTTGSAEGLQSTPLLIVGRLVGVAILWRGGLNPPGKYSPDWNNFIKNFCGKQIICYLFFFVKITLFNIAYVNQFLMGRPQMSRQHQVVIKVLWVKRWSSRHFVEEFPSKGWCRSSLH